MRQVVFGLIISALAFAGDGRTPRASSADYPVHQDTATATIAAVRVPAEQLNKTFPSDFAKKYVVVEVAIYPKEGATVDVAAMDFVLKLADSESRPDTPEEIAGLWRPHTAHPDVTSKTHVTTETGVIVGSGTDPVTGRRVTNTGTYERVGVSNGGDPNRPVNYPTGSSADADRIEAQLAKWELQDGKTSSPVAGYIYFPVAQKKSKGALELQYAHENRSANLTLPAPGK
ncbi:MAG TPA: hypothetical protein VNU44_11210 [Bryobacteraceae bacterium]|nr:hypothetical protein [Bryobacteraceae bacterium]